MISFLRELFNILSILAFENSGLILLFVLLSLLVVAVMLGWNIRLLYRILKIYGGTKMRKQIICLDFDGVIHSYTSGWKGARTIPDPPVAGAIEFMLHALHKYDVVIHSSRARYWGGISAMRKWLKTHAGSLWYDTPAGPGLEDVRFARWKPPAVVTIDDRAIRFTGVFPSPKEVASMPTWTKAEKI